MEILKIPCINLSIYEIILNMEENNPPVNPNPPPSPVPPVQTRHTSMILLIIVVLAVGILGFLIGRSTFLMQYAPPTESSPTLEAMTPSPTPDPTANWKTYTINSLNLSFKLPPELSQYGELEEKVQAGEKGTLFCITFSQDAPWCGGRRFGIGMISNDYDAGRETRFTDTNGYEVENGKYYYLGIDKSGQKYEIPQSLAKEITTTSGVKMLRVRGANATGSSFALPGTPGEGFIGALINLSNPTYPGAAIQMELNETLTENLFDQILSTFQIF